MFSKKKLTFQAIPLPYRSNFDDQQIITAASAFHDQMKNRHSVRDFSSRPVAKEVIEKCVLSAGTAPSGANHQPWHFVAISDPEQKAAIRNAAEKEEKKFYSGGGGDEWLNALEPIGTHEEKPHLERAPWLIVVFAQRYGKFDNGEKFKNYYVNESVGIATGFLLTALHQSGLCSLTHTPNPMKFLNKLLKRPDSEKPIMIIAVGHPAKNATIPAAAKIRKPLSEILTLI